jgi:sugar (pentulose or hexulose) kinase
LAEENDTLPKNYLLSIDLGTSALKVTVYDREFNPVSNGSGETETIYPRPSWAEQDQGIWLRSMTTAVREALRKAGAATRDIEGMGICAQMHGLNLVISGQI